MKEKCEDLCAMIPEEDVVLQCGCEDGAEVELLRCSNCNEPADTIMTSAEASMSFCHKCLYAKTSGSAFYYRPPSQEQLNDPEYKAKMEQLEKEFDVAPIFKEIWGVDFRSEEALQMKQEFNNLRFYSKKVDE